MFDIGFSEMLLLAAIALIAIGPKQLPEVARTVGRLINDLKRATSDLTKTVVDARETTNKVIHDTFSSFDETAQSINNTFIEPVKIEPGHHQEAHHHELHHHEPQLEEPSHEEQLSLLDQPAANTPEKKDS